MLKAIFYGTLFFFGVGATVASPCWGAIAVISAYMLHPVQLVPELSILRIQMVLTAAFIISLLAYSRRTLRPVGNEVGILYLLFAYGIFIFLSTTWAYVDSDISLAWAVNHGKTILFSLLLFRAIVNKAELEMLLWAILFGGAHAAFIHTVGANIGYLPTRFESGEIGAVPDFQGSVMTFVFPSFLLHGVCGLDRWRRSFCLLSLPLVVDSIINTYQRTFFVALAIQCVYLVLIVPNRIRVRIVPFFVVGGVLAVVLFMPTDYEQWIETVADYENEGSAMSRIHVAEASWKMFQDYPLGVGYRNYPYVSPRYLDDSVLTTGADGRSIRSAHNTYFTVLCELGVIGFAMFGAFFIGSWQLLRKVRRHPSARDADDLTLFAYGFETGLVGWAIAGFFQTLHEDDPTYWAIPISVLLYRVRFQKRVQPHRPQARITSTELGT